MKKLFELTNNTRIKFGITLTQIRAVVDFKAVKQGDLGGWVEDESSIHEGCWVGVNGEILKGAVMHGGEMHGGVMHGGVMHGGEMHGGVMRGGEMWGGVMRGGEMWGGVMRGGVMRGGEMWGGVMRGGEMWGGEMRESNHIGFANVGSEKGYLFANIANNTIMISRGCFYGTIDEFYDRVRDNHGDNEHAQLYNAMRPVIEMKLNKFIESK